MTSIRPRDPLCAAAASAAARDILGSAAIAALVGKSESLVNNWADPETASSPTVAQALVIDRACYDKSTIAPFASVFNRQREALERSTDRI